MTEVMMAMSGGVDSSVAAAMLVEAGHSVTGVTLKLWGGETDSGCCSVSDVDDARRVAYHLGIDHHVFNFGVDFDQHVVDPYVNAHNAGLTPNPCIECNRHIKFDKLLQRADALGFDMIATGHHARTVTTGRGHHIARGADRAKDQSYVLYMLDQSQLGRLLLPLGALTKERVREMAADYGLRIAAKPDSQDVCFINSGEREVFLGNRIPLTPARLVDGAGQHLGDVPSIEMVTYGQRRGLNLGGDPGRRYVVDIDHANAQVRVGPRSALLVEEQRLERVSWGGLDPVAGELGLQCSAHGTTRPGRVEGDRVVWSEPQPRVAPGQAIVFYDDDCVVGGAYAGAPPPSTPA